jgi:hypothetical protein
MLGPLGPFGDPAQREEEEAAWAAHAASDSTVMIALLDLARRPATADERGRISEASFQSQLAHVLALAGARAPTTVLDGVGPLTLDPCARATRAGYRCRPAGSPRGSSLTPIDQPHPVDRDDLRVIGSRGPPCASAHRPHAAAARSHGL